MHKAEVEILSDASNFAVLRHPGRKFPGSLIQGDSLHSLYLCANRARNHLIQSDSAAALEELTVLHDELLQRLNHYKRTLGEHDIELPFIERNSIQPR